VTEITGFYGCEFRLVRADGSIRWVRDAAVLVRSADGRPLFWRGVLFDITDLKTAEDAVRSSETKYRALVEQLPAVVYIDSNEADPRSLYVSPSVEQILGYPVATYLAEHDIWPRSVHPEDHERVMGQWRRAVETLEPFTSEYRFVRADGSSIWVRDSSIPIRDEQDEVVCWQGVILDIDARMRAEQALFRSEARYRALVEGIPAVIYEMGPDDERRTLYVSPHVENILGYSRAEWLDQPDIWIELLHPDDREPVLADYDSHNETGEPWSRDYRLIASDGRIVWVRDHAALVRDQSGRHRTWQGLLLDVTAEKASEEALRRSKDELEFRVIARTAELAEANEMMTLEIGERKQVERRLREAQERYRMLVERLPATIYIWDLAFTEGFIDGEPTMAYTSPQIEELVGYTVEEWHSTDDFWFTRVHPHDRAKVDAAVGAISRTGEPFSVEYRYLAKDGSIVWILDQSTLLLRDAKGQPRLYQGVMLDITARKTAEAEAREAEARFRSLAESSNVMAYALEVRHDPSMRLVLNYISPQIEQLLGYPPADLAGDPDAWNSLIHPDDRATVVEEFASNVEADTPWNLEYRMFAADGQIRWVRSEGRVDQRDEMGRPAMLHGILLDVTASRLELERLRAGENHFRSIVESMPAVAFVEVADPELGDERILYMGPQAESVFGWSAEDMQRETGRFERMVHPDDVEWVTDASRRASASGERWDQRYRVTGRDGIERMIHSVAVVTEFDQQGRPRVWHGVAIRVTGADSDVVDLSELSDVLDDRS
jgi:PAS domain S-box-containing protein